jgi:hypothetical protein
MPLTHSVRKPFVVFDSLANSGMGVVIDHWSKLFGIGMDDEEFEVDIAIEPVSLASG